MTPGRWIPLADLDEDVQTRAQTMGWTGRWETETGGAWGRNESDARDRHDAIMGSRFSTIEKVARGVCVGWAQLAAESESMRRKVESIVGAAAAGDAVNRRAAELYRAQS